MRDVDRDWRFERRQHQDDDDWSNGRLSREQKFDDDADFRVSAQIVNQTLLVTVEEAARLLGVGRTTMFELIGRGDVASVRLGRRRLVARKTLATFVEELSI